MPDAFEQRPSLVELASRVLRLAGDYGEAEAHLIRADVGRLLDRAIVAGILGAVAIVVGLVGLAILAQATVTALTPLAGPAAAGFIVAAALLAVAVIAMGMLRARLTAGFEPHSLIAKDLLASQEREPVEARPIEEVAMAARSMREELAQNLEAGRERLEPDKLVDEMITAIDRWTAARNFIGRHKLAIGLLTAAAAWLLPARPAAKTRREARKSILVRSNQPRENRYGHQRTN